MQGPADMRTSGLAATFVLLALSSLVAARMALADVKALGDISPPDAQDPWDLGDKALLVGGADPRSLRFGSGEVIVSGGSALKSAGAIIGHREKSGSVTVTGQGSTWESTGSIELAKGSFSQGTLAIVEGAEVVTDGLVIGASGTASHASVLIDGPGSRLTNKGVTFVGRSEGRDMLFVEHGGTLFSTDTVIGAQGGGSFYVRVMGEGSAWLNTGSFVVGQYGDGILEILDGAEFATRDAEISGGDPSSGGAGFTIVNVGGFGALWSNLGVLTVGARGRGALNIDAYGTVLSENTEIRTAHDLGHVRVHGEQARWENSGDVDILALTPSEPALVVDEGGFASIDGALDIKPSRLGNPSWIGARIGGGALHAMRVQAVGVRLDFAGGKLAFASYTGVLENTGQGALAVGGVYPTSRVAGDYVQGARAALDVTLSAVSAPARFDVTGDMTLAGALRLRLPRGVLLREGDLVEVLHWGGALRGQFDVIELPVVDGELGWDTSALYTNGELRVVKRA